MVETAYAEALGADLPFQIRQVSQRQHSSAAHNHREIRQLGIEYRTTLPVQPPHA